MAEGSTLRERKYLSLCGDAIRLATRAFRDVHWELCGSLSLYYWLGRPLRLPGDVDLQVELELDAPVLADLLQSASSDLAIKKVEGVPFEGLLDLPPRVFQASLARRSADGSVDDIVLFQATAVDHLQGPVWRRPTADLALPEAPVQRLQTIVAKKALRCAEVRTLGGTPARWQDAVDLVAIATSVTEALELESLASAVSLLAKLGRVEIDPEISIPRGWTRLFDQYSYRLDLPWRGFDAWHDILRSFLRPLVHGDQGAAAWSPQELSWVPSSAVEDGPRGRW
jgi:hypothetical protein